MSKLVLAVALLVLLAHASSAYRTTITTVEENDDVKSCREQARMMDLSACEQVVNQMDETMKQCCDQLCKMSDKCQCEGVKYVIQQQIDTEMAPREIQKMMQRTMQIILSCRISHCRLGSAFF